MLLKTTLAFDSLWSLLMSHLLIDTMQGLHGTLLQHLFYKCTFHRKPRINFPKTYRHALPKGEKIKLLHIHTNQNSWWQAAKHTISGLLYHLLGLLTIRKYKQIASFATNF